MPVMERNVREGRQYRSRARVYGEGEEEYRDARKKEKKDDKYSRQKAPSGSQPVAGSVGQTSSGFHRQRDVPPRFQAHSKPVKQHKYSATRNSATAGGKKQTKDPTPNRWHQNPPLSSLHQHHHPHQTTTSHHHPSQPHTNTRQRHMHDDGGWSRGSPAKGSGWSSKNKSQSMPARDTKNQASNQVVLAREWGGSPEGDSAAAVWPMSEHKHQGSSGSGEGDGWNTFSPGQSNSSRQHSQSENWMSDEGSLGIGDNPCLSHTNSSPSPSNVGWNVVPDVQHELEPIEDDELDGDLPGGNVEDTRTKAPSRIHCQAECSDKSDEEEVHVSRKSGSWEDQDAMSVSTSDKDTLVQNCSKHRASSSYSSSDEQHHSKNTSCSPSADMDKTVESTNTECDTTTSTFASTDREIHRQHDEATTNLPQCQSTSGTPEGLGMSVWKYASVGGSTSSINSVGSSSSWKSEGKNGYHSKQPNFSPRKSSRYDSQISNVSSSSGVKIRKLKKPSTGLDDALESLHSEPSGWGDLPSPKPTDVDNGTEIWGVAPVDMHRKNKSSNSWIDGGGGVGKMGGGNWGEDNPGTLAAGWPGAGDGRGRPVGRVCTPGTPGSQWMPPKQDGWSKKNKQHNFPENVSKLVDMGFSHQMIEKYLKANSNDLDATIGDLLAIGVAADDGSLERMMSTSNSNRTSQTQPGKPLLSGVFNSASNSFSGITTPPSVGPLGTPGANNDLYHQQLMPNSLSTLMQSQPPLPSGGNQAQQMQLLQMQQRYMQMPSATVLGYQQMLSQQLSQLKRAKQQVTQQLRQVNAMTVQGSGSSAAQQQLQTRLNLINQFISHINQQLMLQKYPSHQKDKSGMADGGKSVTPGAVGAQPLGRNTPPSRNKDMKLSGPIPSRSLSLPGGAHEHNLALGMQGLSMNGHVTPSSISQSSARSVSRLQQIISGSSTDNPHSSEEKNKFQFPPVQSASTPAEMFSSTSSPLASSGSSTTTTTPASTPFSPARSFTDIQEFRPGVPWQPRALPTEPAQLYAEPVPPQHPELRTAQSEPSFSHQLGHNFRPGMRPQRRPPSLGYNPRGGNMAPGSFRARGTPSEQQQGWPSSSMARGSTSSPMTNSPFGGAATPDNSFSSNTAAFGARPRQQMPPTSNFAFNGAGEFGPPLTRPNALFPNPRTFSQAPGRPPSSSSTSSDTGRWGSSCEFPNSNGSTSSSCHPPSSLTSSVWDSSATGSNQSWSLGLDTVNSDGHSHTTPTSAAEPPHPRFTSPPNTSSSDGLAPGLRGAWDKGGLQSPDHKSTVLSPEPTFAEWQAGKKAHLSVFKLPSNPPSPWLCIHNVNSQVDEASLRDVCSEFGILESVVFSPSIETALVQYSSKEQAMQAKTGLDKSPVICGVSVAVDFVSEDKVSNFLLQLQQHQRAGGRSSAQKSRNSSHDKWITAQPGNSGLVSSSRWDSMKLAQPRTNTSSNSDGGSSKSAAAAALWSGNAFLPGLSSPWSSQPPPAEFASSDKQEPPAMSNNPSLSTYLPNGLF